MTEKQKSESILLFAIRIGEIMLKSGAETYRVEDTIIRILSKHNYVHVDTFVTPTVIMATIKEENVPVTSMMRRIKNRQTRLDKIELINQLSRDYVSNDMLLDDAILQLHNIESKAPYPKYWIVLATGVSSGFFCLMFYGRIFEFLIAFVTGIIVALLQFQLRKKEIVNYFVLFIVSFVIGIVVMFTTLFFSSYLNTEAIVIGCIMSLVPGVAFTNAIRDTIGDELLSGISRGVEALFIAIAIASGIGIPMSFGIFLGGY
ncbi:MAG: threonine/serine ThrE exporter family protein [Cellulosilyticaceae bacterium]